MATISTPLSVTRQSTALKQAYYLGLVVLAAIGIAALSVRLINGLRVTALTSTIAWGLWVSIYIFFIGLSAGSFLLSTLVCVFGVRQYEKVGRLALLSALFALVGGALFIWVDLGHPERFWEVFTSWNYTSVLAWEVLLYVFYPIVIVIELWFLLREDLAGLRDEGVGWSRRFYGILALGFRPATDHARLEADRMRSRRTIRALGILGIPLAIGVHGGTGSIFAVLIARPYWFSGLFPIIFLVSALSSGAALMTGLYALAGRRDAEYPGTVRGLANLMVLFIALDWLLLAAEYLVGLYGGKPDEAEVYRQILFGPFFYTFWVGQLLLGAVVPIVLVAWRKTRERPFWLGLAGFSAVLGIVAVRLNLVIPAYVVPVLKGLDRAYLDPRWAYSYFPSVLEWATTIGLVGLLALAFSIAFELLPICATERSEA